jgi:type IV secretion system protein VirB8
VLDAPAGGVFLPHDQVRRRLKAHQSTGPRREEACRGAGDPDGSSHPDDPGDSIDAGGSGGTRGASVMKRDESLQHYLAEARSWDSDRVSRAYGSARTAWWFAGAGWICSLTVAAALMLLMPLKRVDPFVIRVDNRTGIVDVVPVYAGNARAEESMTRYFLTHYVSVCERFNFATAESDYEECGAFHSAQRNQSWYALWNPTNPQSPLNVYKDGRTIRVQVQSVSFFERGTGVSDLAQVRYLKAERQGTAAERPTYWIATIQYAYAAPSKEAKTRRWNPMGFKIIDFKSEPEVLSAPQTEQTDKALTGTVS